MKLLQLRKMLLVAVGLAMESMSAWGAVTWDFTNSTIWGSVTLPAEANSYADQSYAADGTPATTGNFITIHSTEGKITRGTVSGSYGITWTAAGSTTDNYIKMSVPAGSTVTVSGYFSGNRNIIASFKGSTTTMKNNSWGDNPQDFVNDTEEPLDLYLYANNNNGASSAPQLRSISLKQTVTVTTNYVDEDENVIKTATVQNVEVGTAYTSTYDATYYVNNTDPYKYTYVSGALTSQVINEATSYNIIYHKSDRASYTLNATQSYGGKSQKLINNKTVLEGASYKYSFPRYILDGATLYEYASSTDPSTHSTYYHSNISSMTGDADYTLTYNAKEGICVFYQEAEDIETKSNIYNNETYGERSSAGALAVFSNAVITTLPAGTYSISMRALGKVGTSTTNTVSVYKGSNAEGNLLVSMSTANATNTNRAEASNDNFELTASTDIIANGGYYTTSDQGYGADYFYIMAKNLTATITSTSGFATLYTPYALNFAGVENLAAYTATVSGNTVTLTKVDDVPANTGVVLKGEVDSYNIPVIATATNNEQGDLTGSATESLAYADIDANYDYYIMSLNGEGKAQFNKFTSGTIAAGKAYLKIAKAGANNQRALRMVFADEATGISSTQNENELTNESVYNLQGQRVAQPAKGLYIRGGKKVVIK